MTSQRQPLDSQERVSFEKSLESFVSESQSKLRSLRMDEQPFLNKYLFVHLKKNATSSTNFNCRVLVGQEYEGVGGGNCLADSQMFKYVEKHSVFLFFMRNMIMLFRIG